jgi:hypothetical protein
VADRRSEQAIPLEKQRDVPLLRIPLVSGIQRAEQKAHSRRCLHGEAITPMTKERPPTWRALRWTGNEAEWSLALREEVDKVDAIE